MSFNIKLINKIEKGGLKLFEKNQYNVGESVENPDAYLVRSAPLHHTEFEPSLLAIARAGAGVNNIPLERCAEQGIVVFNTPGANANGVKELAMAALLLSSRKISDGIEWAKSLKGQPDVEKLVEKGKSKFAGPEIKGKKLGVIGLGAIGGIVANGAYNMGMDVIGCDPFITVDAAWSLSRAVERAENYDEIYEKSDYITLHIPSLPTTKGLINKETIAKMKDGVRIINLSRGDIVNNNDILEALASGKVACYVTDFPCEELLGVDGVIAIPHLGASTPEAEDNCAVVAVHQVIDYLENGNITNSVNYPSVSQPRIANHRICILHKNVPNMLAQFSALLSARNVNIESLANSSRKDYAYSIIETNDDINNVIAEIRALKSVIRAFVK
ncbi:MAG: 3-phosphoglycerate dehydrogenase family protein [Eubacteriales bacterium]|nr:3-phosphoglycerate dehydrogenase family protein [Eubacteriales bacterium]MDD4476203.1 3-phosphoglycerate dehydrogenase family protein [Eubacteriales bacterium]